jgi:hypothetical protein
MYHQKIPDTVLTARENKENEPGQPWNIALQELEFSGNSIQYFDDTKPYNKGSVDFDHLWLTGIDIDARDIRYAGAVIETDIRNIAFREQSGFVLRSLTADIMVGDTGAAIKDFVLLTGHSRLQMDATAGYSSLKDIAKTYPQARLKVDVAQSFVNVRDILNPPSGIAYPFISLLIQTWK